jgi:hypothetical protein
MTRSAAALWPTECEPRSRCRRYDPLSFPPNPVAQAVLTTLGHPYRRWAGTIAIVGNENEHGITASLTAEQSDIVGKAHGLALTAA